MDYRKRGSLARRVCIKYDTLRSEMARVKIKARKKV